MDYKSDHLTRELKRARLDAGLSQRALSERSGLTQSHISNIESGATEPGLSSLIDLARALDLEVMLVPRKRIPAVSSLVETRSGFASRDLVFRREIDRSPALLAELAKRLGDKPALDEIGNALMLLGHARLDPEDIETVLNAIDKLRRAQRSPEPARRAREVAEILRPIRDKAVHPRLTPVRGAYSLQDGDDND